MFWRKHAKPAVEQPEKTSSTDSKPLKQRKKSVFWRIIKYFFLFMFIVILGATGGAWWITQTAGGQAWLVKTANATLGKSQDLKFKITHLAGSLPFNFEIGLEAADSKGIWLKAPENKFVLDWRALPKALQIDALSLRDIDLLRFPDIPAKPEEPATEKTPLTMSDIREMLARGAEFMKAPPKWMPEIRVGDIGIENALLPPGLISAESEDRLRIDANLAMSLINGVANLDTAIAARDGAGNAVKLPQLELQSANVELSANIKPVVEELGLDATASLRVKVNNTRLAVADLPADFLGDNPALEFDLKAVCNLPENDIKTSVILNGPTLDAGHLALNGKGNWQSGSEFIKGSLDGPMAYSLKLKMAPVAVDEKNASSPLAMVRAPVAIHMNLQGNLPKTDVNFDIQCADVEKDNHSIKDTVLAISAKDVIIPLNDSELLSLERENHLNIALKSLVDKEDIDLSTELFFQALPKIGATGTRKERKSDQPESTPADWRVGLRNLHIDAAGITGAGNIAALLAPADKPALDGNLNIAVRDWRAISVFVPDQKLAGKVDLNLELVSGQDNSPLGPISTHKLTGPSRPGNIQNVNLGLDIPTFSMTPEKGGDAITLRELVCRGKVKDVFNRPDIAVDLHFSRLSAAGMQLGAKIAANGAITGPLNVDVQSTGDVTSKIAVQWEPGKLLLRTLDVGANLANFMGQKSRNAKVGLRSSQSAEITYGDAGISVSGLDVAILPAGRLSARGAMGREKLDFNLALDKMDFKPWQRIVPQLPTGAASIHATLSGTPQRPGGKFNLALANVAIPAMQIPPISAALVGEIVNRSGESALNLKLELDPKSRQAFGGDEAIVRAGIPLKFGTDGIPQLNMDGPLAARIRWNGALGPIWNFLPMSGQRLNGRINIDLQGAGTMKKPLITGGVKVEKARYENLLVGVLITDINASVNLSEDKGLGRLQDSTAASLPGSMTLSMSASDGRGGTVSVNGGGALDGKRLNITANINRLKPLRRRDVHIELSGDARVTGEAAAPVITGEIRVNRGEILLDNLAFSGSVTTLPISNPGKEKNKKAAAPVTPAPASGDPGPANQGSLNVRILIPPRFTVDGRGLSSIWEANLLVGGTITSPQITGSINAVKGNFDFLGKNFALSKGNVTFAGGSIANPLLEIELTNEMPDLTAHIWVTGPVDKMKISLTSEPSMPRDEILSCVLFGKSINDLTRLEALQLAAAVAQLAGFGGGSNILNFAKKALGVDVLRVGTSNTGAAGEPGDQTAGGTTIEMGKYINDIIYMGVQQGMKADSTAFIIQLELTPRTSLEVRTEQTNTWGGLKWKMNY